jgi:MYXO-CTERM domain-containing protein
MVVPVPVVLQEADVKTLPHDVLAKLEVMDAPRLVEYWEQDPCAPERDYKDMPKKMRGRAASGTGQGYGADPDTGVTVEAQFSVGEYDIVILSATDSTGLETWLAREKYAIPAGAEPLLRPYVEGSWKFFVAKVDPKKVTFEGEQAKLSPLRFHYDSDDFVLPVRLGLINSSGKQDLIVHILAPGTRYEVANYPNVFIPTNLDLKPEARGEFAAFYAALFDRTVEKNPRAIVTEYAWDAGSCDPCPGPTISFQDLQTLGGDVIGGGAVGSRGRGRSGMVLTRLHARYGTDLSEDLVFQKASPVQGGREIEDATGKLEETAAASGINNFQARYAIRHEWTGPIECANPVRGRWGGPPAGETYKGPQAGRDLAFAPRGKVQLAQMVAGDVPELEVKAAGATPAVAPAPDPKKPHTKSGPEEKKGCGCAADGGGAAGTAALSALVALLMIRRRRS